ncbi:MAG: diacylglycerol kinase family lipid kinase [Deltaproteobacteria bacterium]|nr:diacylglycerol kinase family lipid kinase [Deltaproteobacteria bacterium]MBM4322294.1 diacylglycerol kinase family lipid kinase [Deltaproteobacteria bacterium]
MKILVIVNPAAGGGKTLRLLPRMKHWLSESSHHFLYEISSTPDEMRSKIMSAPARGIDAILLSGGDGTVHHALPAIAETCLPFGYLPCGRGNDFARNISLPADLKSNCSFLSNPSLRKLDLPSINQKTPFVAVAYVGFDGEVNRLANDHKGYFGGTLGYIICVLKALKNFKPFEVEITIDAQTWRERVMMVSVANAPFYGGGMKIAPEAVMDDGLLDICMVKEISKFELLRQFPKVFKGTHVTHPRIMMATGRKIKIVSDEERDLFADGEPAGRLPAECNIGNQTIRVLAPIF